ncbi:Pathoproteinsis-related protein P2 isoform 2 [Hibiscus syriacus]|uniref:Pathoproteinsis-related protein P2 isoform 2 n=1 Tax=Hibiscus syriacus TaxID=106335 RepID=A0A6A3BZP4_HIBSY|nr:Pathoproteinsis-related protein P2 isoform 2 [Hibiscus syriacus]
MCVAPAAALSLFLASYMPLVLLLVAVLWLPLCLCLLCVFLECFPAGGGEALVSCSWCWDVSLMQEVVFLWSFSNFSCSSCFIVWGGSGRLFPLPCQAVIQSFLSSGLDECVWSSLCPLFTLSVCLRWLFMCKNGTCERTGYRPNVATTTAVYISSITPAFHEPYKIDWDLNKAGVACAPFDADKPLEWRRQHYWASFCRSNGPSFPASCGQCLKVTNLVNEVSVVYNWSYGVAACGALDGGKPLEWRQRYGWTGYCGNVIGSELKDISGQFLKEIVRLVDRCGSGGLVLDLDTAFRPIDIDGQDSASGHLTVDYQVVQCEDDVDSPLLLYSQ